MQPVEEGCAPLIWRASDRATSFAKMPRSAASCWLQMASILPSVGPSMGPPCEKSKRSRSGCTIDPFWSM
jgi:hypothetical protein